MNYFDLHCDTLFEIYHGRGSLNDNQTHVSLTKLDGFEQYAQIFALFCGDVPLGREEAQRRLPTMLKTAEMQFAECAGRVSLCRSKAEYKAALSQGKVAAFLSVEGAELLQTDELLRLAYDGGVRFVTLTWNHPNCFGSGAPYPTAGLTAEGKIFLRKLEQYGMICDVSHLSESGFFDVCDHSCRPFLASHSNSAAVWPHRRNLTDAQFLEIRRRGGLVGINLYAPFLGAEPVTAEDIFRHVEHFLALDGADVLAFGCDFDGCDAFPAEITDLSDMPALYETMLQKNYPENLVRKLFFYNADAFINRMF